MLRSTHLLQPGLASPENTQLCPSCQNVPVLHAPLRNALAERTAGLEGHPFSYHKDFCSPLLAHLNTNKCCAVSEGQFAGRGTRIVGSGTLVKDPFPPWHHVWI